MQVLLIAASLTLVGSISANACDTVQAEINMDWCVNPANKAEGQSEIVKGGWDNNEALVRSGYYKCQDPRAGNKVVEYLTTCDPALRQGVQIARRLIDKYKQ